MGISRGVRNGSVLNAILSAFIPVYGLIYFFARAVWTAATCGRAAPCLLVGISGRVENGWRLR
jgi:hypothetical protein